MDEKMIPIYVRQIERKAKTIDDVPERIRDRVAEKLSENAKETRR